MPHLKKKILLYLVWVAILPVVLHGKVFSESISSENVEWHLVEMEGAAVTPLPGGKRPTLLLNPANKKAEGFSGCNNYFSQYELKGPSLKFGLIGSTRRACPDAESIIERNFFSVLENTRAWEIKDGRLALLSGNDELVRFTINKTNDAVPDLDSLTIRSKVYTKSLVTLAHGEYRAAATPDSASEVVVKLTDKRAFGIWNGKLSGAVVVVTTMGGTGTFYELALLNESTQGWANIDMVLLGDRARVHSLAIERDHITIVMTTHSLQDPMCCPTLTVIKCFAVQGDRLVMVSEGTY